MGHIEKDTDLSVLFAVFKRYFALDCNVKMCVSLGLCFFFQEGCEIFVLQLLNSVYSFSWCREVFCHVTSLFE